MWTEAKVYKHSKQTRNIVERRRAKHSQQQAKLTQQAEGFMNKHCEQSQQKEL